jgi:hypothetical protein
MLHFCSLAFLFVKETYSLSNIKNLFGSYQHVTQVVYQLYFVVLIPSQGLHHTRSELDPVDRRGDAARTTL